MAVCSGPVAAQSIDIEPNSICETSLFGLLTNFKGSEI